MLSGLVTMCLKAWHIWSVAGSSGAAAAQLIMPPWARDALLEGPGGLPADDAADSHPGVPASTVRPARQTQELRKSDAVSRDGGFSAAAPQARTAPPELSVGGGEPTSRSAPRPLPGVPEPLSHVGPGAKPPQAGVQGSKDTDVRDSPLARALLEIYRQLCAWRCSGAGGVKRLSSEQRNQLAAMYTPLIQVEPPAPLVGQRPGGRPTADSVDCKAREFSHILTGRKRPEGPRVVVDVFTGMGGGPELELLELRFHELDGVADIFVVTESHYGNHGDQKPMHFQAQRERFTAFLPRILHVRTDECPKYLKEAQKVQKDEKRGQKGVWNLQGIQRSCAVDALAAYRSDLPDDALVILSDLDELPKGATMNVLKQCEIQPTARFPLFFKLKVVPFNLRTGCPASRELYNKGTVSYWKKFRKGKTSVWPLGGTDNIPSGGVHLSSMGNLGQVSYKLLNHGESAQIASLVVPHDLDIKTCSVTNTSVVQLLQQELNEKPISVLRHWEKDKNAKKKPLGPADPAKLVGCDLPWPLLTSPQRYPFLWGNGSLL